MKSYRIFTSGQGQVEVYQKNNLALCHVASLFNENGRWHFHQGFDDQGHAKRISDKNYARFIHEPNELIRALIEDNLIERV